MNKINQPGGSKNKVRDLIKSSKKKARIGFLESLGDSGYDNRTDPKYCFDILRKFMNKDASDEETLD